MFYKLEEHTPAECNSGQEWAEWFEKAGDRRIVAGDEIGDFLVSTVFVGIDPAASIDPAMPLLFETMIFQNDKTVGKPWPLPNM